MSPFFFFRDSGARGGIWTFHSGPPREWEPHSLAKVDAQSRQSKLSILCTAVVSLYFLEVGGPRSQTSPASEQVRLAIQPSPIRYIQCVLLFSLSWGDRLVKSMCYCCTLHLVMEIFMYETEAMYIWTSICMNEHLDVYTRLGICKLSVKIQ